MSPDAKPTGGPVHGTTRKVGSAELREGGLTVRDWFAGHAAAAMLQKGLDPAAIARTAYLLADAMLAERDR